MSDKAIDKVTKSVPYSKFELSREQLENLTIQDLENINSTFWTQQSVKLHRCYSRGQAYANNNNKKDSLDLLQDMFKLLKNQYKDSCDNIDIMETTFDTINNMLKTVKTLQQDVDKNCILSIIQGYTLGCLKKYEKQ